MEECGSVIVKYTPKGRPKEAKDVRVCIKKYADHGCPYYFLRAEEDRFFSGFPHPYVVDDLLRDSLFFGAATARTLDYLFPQGRCVLLLQDWETATVALALGARRKYRPYLTLHNSYDSGAVYAEDLETFGIDPASCPGSAPGSCVLERAIPFIQQPVITVSDQFALDLKHDILQTEVMAPQLARMERFQPVGINNGPFTDLHFDRAYTLQGFAGFQSLQEQKVRRRVEFLRALRQHEQSEREPIWGDLDLFSQEELPWFVMAGRDDQHQKGYDVAAHAVGTFLRAGGRAKFVFLSIPGDRGTSRLEFLRRVSEQHPRLVLVLPFLLNAGYLPALQSATYGLLPSFYEPFGMVNELYLNGVVPIGRATGGIIQQVVPLQAAACFSPTVRRLTERWQDLSSRPTGILYRERDDIPSAVEDWKLIHDVQPQLDQNPNMNVRESCATFRSMCDELLLAIKDGVRVYTERPELYYSMLIEGVSYIERTFSWERAAAEYVRYCMGRRDGPGFGQV
jgi:glycogen synthase